MTCTDKHCPVHKKVSLRGRTLVGNVIKTAMHRTAKVRIERLFKIPKYERYEKRVSIIKAHNPDCLNVKIGDRVRMTEVRPISKTKNFVIVEVLK